MPLIDREGRALTDAWHVLEDGAALPAHSAIIVSLARWQADRAALLDREGPLGLILRSDEKAEPVLPDLEKFALIALDFPKFTDGRSYSTARLLRERHGYKCELRAVGQVLRDQLQFLRRCGFDTFQLRGDAPSAGPDHPLVEISVAYQAAADDTRRAADQRATERTGYETSRVCAAYWAY